MAGAKTEYPALLAALQPNQAVSVLNSRVKQIEKINEDVSEWLAERRKVEEAYVAGLTRLAARRYDSGSVLGVFQAPWQGIISGALALSDAHSNFANRILTDVENPLKEQRRDLQSMASLQSNLASLARDVEKTAKKPGASAESARSQWDSQAPYVFEQLQTLDETRVNQMREALTQLQTHEIDCHERGKTSAETGLNALLNVDTPDEVSAFVARTSSEIPPSAPLPETPRADASARTRAQTSRSEREMTGNLAPLGNQVSEDRRSNASGHSEDTPKEKKSRLSGLRRLGTVMSRRKDKEKLDEKPSEKPGDKSAKNKRKNPLRRNSTANNPIPSPNASLPDLPNNSSTRRTSTHEEEKPNPIREESSADRPVAMPDTGDLYDADDAPAASTAPTTNGQLMAGGVPQIGIRPPSTIVEEGTTVSSAIADMERAQAEANAQEPEGAFNLNIRDKPIQEESSDQQQAAMANVSNTLRASIQPPPARRSGTLRGRRDVRNTVFVPNSLDPVPSAAPIPGVLPPSASPTIAPVPSPIVPSESRPADTQSIRSARSVSSTMAPGAVKHPEMMNPGLNASIVETSSATFENGSVTKAVVIGELAFVHNGAVAGPSAPHVRLDNFPVLEKVAPNPAFVSQIPSRSGEYNIDLTKISTASVGFKYQVHLNEAQLSSYAPLLLTTQHRIEANQTSVILSYALNPDFAAPLGADKSVSLQNVVVMLTLEGGRATSCQSKPPGVFSRDKSLIYWKLDDLALSAGDAPGKLLARFATEGEAKGASAEARWESKGAGSGLGVSIVGGDGAAGSSDPFADARISSTSLANAAEVPVMRKLIGGRYTSS